jgi:uncharacterized small protein (DUF1192 family)
LKQTNDSTNQLQSSLEASNPTSSDSDIQSVGNEFRNLHMLIENQSKTFVDFFTKEKQECQSKLTNQLLQISNLSATLAKLQAELEAAKAEIALKEEFQRKLEDQRKATFNERIEELSAENEKLKLQMFFNQKSR